MAPDPLTILQDNLQRIRDRVRTVCSGQGRDPDSVTLVAVTKNVSADIANLLSLCGVHDVGENRVMDALDKARTMTAAYRWHLIGSLQTNKVKKALGFFTVLHSLDRMDLAAECQKQLVASGKFLDAFVQVNVSGEGTKQGFKPEQVEEAVHRIREGCPNLRVVGLMTMAPQGAQENDLRKCFRTLRELAERHHLPHLSMGMSQDYTLALEEGADYLRIGTAVFEGVLQKR